MANNQYVNKVVYGENTLIDLTSDTIAANKIVSGYTAHDKSGAGITGTIPIKTNSDIIISTSSAQGYQLIGIEGPAGYYASNFEKQISSIYMDIPASGSHKFTIYIPNGTTTPTTESDYIPLEIEVDNDGNSNITDSTASATGVSF